MAGKKDAHFIRYLELGDSGKDVVAVKRMIARADVGYEPNIENGQIGEVFGKKLQAAVKRFQRKNKLKVDGEVGYMTTKALVKLADARDGKLLSDFAKEHVGDWGLVGQHSAFAGIDMGVDFTGKGHIPMFADGEIVRVVRSGSGWPGIGGLIVVQCDKGPMSKFPIYVAEDIEIPAGHRVGKRLKKGEILAHATGSNQAPGIEIGWAGPAPNFHGTLFQAKHGKYTSNPRATAEGGHFFQTLSTWISKGL
jgi:Putative peptidoglycan binding domain